MTTANETTATVETELPGFATESNGTTARVISDPELAMQTFVIAPVADHFGRTAEEVEEDFDIELIFAETVYLGNDSTEDENPLEGRLGYRVKEHITEELFYSIVDDSRAGVWY